MFSREKSYTLIRNDLSKDHFQLDDLSLGQGLTHTPFAEYILPSKFLRLAPLLQGLYHVGGMRDQTPYTTR